MKDRYLGAKPQKISVASKHFFNFVLSFLNIIKAGL